MTTKEKTEHKQTNKQTTPNRRSKTKRAEALKGKDGGLASGKDAGAWSCTPHPPQSQLGWQLRERSRSLLGSFLHLNLMNSSWEVTFVFPGLRIPWSPTAF